MTTSDVKYRRGMESETLYSATTSNILRLEQFGDEDGPFQNAWVEIFNK